MSAVITGMAALTASARTPAELAGLLFSSADGAPCGSEDCDRTAELRAGCGEPRDRLDACTRMAIALADDALADAALDPSELARRAARIGVVVNCNLGVVNTVVRVCEVIHRNGSRALSVLDLPNASPNVASSRVGIRHALRGPNLTLTGGWGGSLQAVAEADVLLRADRADAVLVIGVESLVGFAGALLRELTDVPLVSGGAALLLEREDSARRRGARVRARIAAHHTVQDSGATQRAMGARCGAVAQAIRTALREMKEGVGLILGSDAGRGPAHREEEEGLVAALDSRCIPRTAPKARLGESYGAAGILALVSGVLCLEARCGFGAPTSWRSTPAVERVAPLLAGARELAPRGILVLGGGVGEPWTAVGLCPA